MTTLAVVIAVSLLAVIICSIVCCKRYGLGALLVSAKHGLKILVLLLAIVAAILICMLSCYAQMCEVIKEMFTIGYVEHLKATLKMISGADSVLMALQTLALTSAMISFVSCVACIFGGIVVFVFGTYFVRSRMGVSKSDRKDTFSVRFSARKTFLVYSKFNS